MIHYGVTKTAQLGCRAGLAELTAGTGVTVNAVLPGRRVRTASEPSCKMAERTARSRKTRWARFMKRHRPTSLMQRFATVDEVASMVVCICSPQASATNGAPLRVEGGLLRSVG